LKKQKAKFENGIRKSIEPQRKGALPDASGTTLGEPIPLPGKKKNKKGRMTRLIPRDRRECEGKENWKKEAQ